MFRPATALFCAALIFVSSLASAEPILQPRKYYGPIPQSAFYLRGGMLGGASADEMIHFLDSKVQPPFESTSEDFGNAPNLELGYVHKPHPRFGVRLNGSWSQLKATGSGNMIAASTVPPDTLPPVLNYSREFTVNLFEIEASAIYYFTDASVKEFQSYVGGGFTFGFPHQTFTETRTRDDNGAVYGDGVDKSEWDFAAGVHAVLGALYYLSNRWGVTGEGRVQLLESSFDQLEVRNEFGDLEQVGFVTDYTGFFLNVGVFWAF